VSDHDHREEICPDCQATEGDHDTRIIAVDKDPETGLMYTRVTYHHDTCPAYTVQQILIEDSVRRAEEEAEWMLQEFPRVHARIKAAAEAGAGDPAPFIAALLELVDAQGEDLERFVTPERWTEILAKHFPPETEGPARPDEEPAA
jgi:hypothetical protein